MSTAAPAVPAAQQSSFHRFWRSLKQLFHELVGAMFAVLALGWLNVVFRSWTRDAAHWLLVVGLIVAALFAFFSVTSFRRSRRV
jgi:ABC-type multidrug transport system permease subunit